MIQPTMSKIKMHAKCKVPATSLVVMGLLSMILCSCRGVPVTPTQSPSMPSAESLDSRQTQTPNQRPPKPGTPAVEPAPSAAAARPSVMSLSDNAPRHTDVQPVGHTVPVTPVVLPFEVPNAGAPPAVAMQTQPGLSTLPCQPAYTLPAPGVCPTCMPAQSQWIPPGLAPPWPQDEYLCDGGDKIPSVRVGKDWSVAGLGLEDTVVHYDTLDGQTRVEPTNRVCVYAPRFAAVRKVYGLLEHEGHQLVAGVELPTGVRGTGDSQTATTTVQPLQPELDRGTLTASAFRDRKLAPILENRESLSGAQGALLPYEDFTLIRNGQMDNSEKARLAACTAAAAAWSRNAAVQVLIDNIAARADAGSNAPSSVHVYKMHGKSRLRVCKVASRQNAHPGEIVEFTLRFDNVGDQLIGNVTVIDNLTTRLEYVEGSQTCSLKANFASTANQGDSLTLRWEITDPIKVAQGGVIRFKCRVR